MYKLKDYPNHQQAFIEARSRVPEIDFPYGQFIYFEYFVQIQRLEKKSVSVIQAWKDHPDVSNGLIYAVLYPFQAEDCEDSELPGDVTLEWLFLAVEDHVVHNKTRAADYCGTSIRQLERWMGDGLKFFKIGNERLFIESDLWDYMSNRGVGQRVKSQTAYIEGQEF